MADARPSHEMSIGMDLCRWFVLKQGKIFWFKSDIVDPVSLEVLLKAWNPANHSFVKGYCSRAWSPHRQKNVR